MAIEGPLRELGIHDVFQLLDLSRKTGRLRVTSSLRDNEGTVYFRDGRVIAATIRSNPHRIGQLLLRSGKVTEAELEQARAIQQQAGETRRLGDILVDLGALPQRELDRQVRRQIEAVVFELLSWQEGFFSFEDGEMGGDIGDPDPGISTESLLMEAARRIDEWTRIAHRIPSLSVVPVLADADGEHAPALDLQPNEWEVLAAIDGAMDLRTIASAIGISDFDAARVVYGLLTTGVVELRREAPSTASVARDDLVVLVSDARQALREGRALDALTIAERALALAPGLADARSLAGEALMALERYEEAEAYLDGVLEEAPRAVSVLMASARLGVKRGDLARAVECWQRVVLIDGRSPAGEQARQALAHAARLNALAEVGADV